MVYFKDDDHKELFYLMMEKLKTDDIDYTSFAYLASSIGKTELLDAVDARRVKHEQLLDLSSPYSSSEKAMIELGYQLFNGNNLYERDEKPVFSTVNNIFYSLDSNNREVALSAIKSRYL